MYGIVRGIVMSLCLPAVAGADELRLTFVSFNIRYETTEDQGWRAWSDRMHRVIATVRRMDPDVMGVQEALHSQVADMRLSLPDYDFHGFGRDDGKTLGEYCGIFYRRSRFIADTNDAGVFWLSATPDKPGSKTWGNEVTRIATWIRLTDRQSGRGFSVYNTHWDHQHQGSRIESARLIAQRIEARKHAREPLVLLGDFNATEGNEAVDLLAGRREGWGNPLCDVYHTLHPHEQARRTFHFWKNQKDGWAKVDHIFASHPATVVRADIVHTPFGEMPASDHYPVSATIVWP